MSIRKNLLFLCCFFAGHLAFSQVIGKTFPELSGETVDDKSISLPNDIAGKYSLIGMAYSKKSEEELNSWFQPVFQTFVQKSTGLLSSFTYDVNVYFVPMFTGVNAAATGTAKRKAIKNIDPKLLPYILFYKGELKSYKEALDFEKKDIPYFFVLDPQGKIVYATSGKYADEKMEEIEAKIE
mgnify:CR=1 FL=1